MPTMKKEVFESIKMKLEAEQQKTRFELSSNRFQMAQLIRKQTQLKHELATFGELLRSMLPKERS